MKTELSLSIRKLPEVFSIYYTSEYGQGDYCIFTAMDNNLDDETKNSVLCGDRIIVKLKEQIKPKDIPEKCYLNRGFIIKGIGVAVAQQFKPRRNKKFDI